MNFWKILLAFCSSVISFVFLPSFVTTLLGGVVGFAVCALIYEITNIQDEVAPNTNDNINTCANEEIIDSDDYNSRDVNNETQTYNLIPSTSAIFMDKIKPSSLEIKLPEQISSKPEDQLLHSTDMKCKTIKDMNLIYPLVTNSSYEDVKLILVQQTKNVQRILTSTNLLDDLPGDNTAPDILPASSKDEASTGYPSSNNPDTTIDEVLKTVGEVSTGYPVPFNDSDTTTDEVRRTVAEISTGYLVPSNDSDTSIDEVLKTVGEVSTGYPVPSNDSDTTIDEVRTTVAEISTGYPVSSNDSDTTIDEVLKTVGEVSTGYPVSSNDSDTTIDDVRTTMAEISTGYPVPSNDSATTIDEVRTMVIEENAGNMKIELKERKPFGIDVLRKYPLDSIPMEFIYPCLPYYQY